MLVNENTQGTFICLSNTNYVVSTGKTFYGRIISLVTSAGSYAAQINGAPLYQATSSVYEFKDLILPGSTTVTFATGNGNYSIVGYER